MALTRWNHEWPVSRRPVHAKRDRIARQARRCNKSGTWQASFAIPAERAGQALGTAGLEKFASSPTLPTRHHHSFPSLYRSFQFLPEYAAGPILQRLCRPSLIARHRHHLLRARVPHRRSVRQLSLLQYGAQLRSATLAENWSVVATSP